MLEQYLELKKKQAEIEKQLETLKREIRAKYDIGEHEVNGIQVKISKRMRFDLDKEKVMIKIGSIGYQECEKVTEYEVITVKLI
jgi:translation initiation factor IF-3